MPVILGILLVVLGLIALLPLSLLLRFRAGTARRPGRRWVATTNFLTIALSVCVFLLAAAVTSTWVPDAFRYALLGLAAGCLLGLLGLALTRWEATPRALYYTPNRWLVLGITLVVSSRLVYGCLRGWQSWSGGVEDSSWIVTAGVPGSLAAGAVVLGYYLTYWAGVRQRLKGYTRWNTSEP